MAPRRNYFYRHKLFLLFIIFFLLLSNSYAQNSSDKEIPKELDSLIAQRYPNVSPGCEILVMKKGDTLYRKAYGLANMELNVPMRPEMIFRIGSITKQYTAVAILQLVEQGKISLQDSIQKFITEFPNKGQTITIGNLLTHTSGISDYGALDFHIPNAIRIDFPTKQIIDSLDQLPLEFTPGSKFSYSNSNYFLLAYIIQEVSGKSYMEYLTENIFEPASLSHTYYDSPTEIIAGRVNGYSKINSKYYNAGYISMSLVFGAGALLSNVDDMYKWHEALYHGKLIKLETLQKAFTPFKLSNGTSSEYGYGWFIKNRNGSKSIEHSGGIDGFQSDEIYFPEQDIFIATLYNSVNEGGSDMSFMALDNDIATLCLGKQLEKSISVDTEELKKYVGVYESDPQHPAIITLENGQLQMEAKAGGLPKSPLFAKSKNVFFLKVIDAEIEFAKENNKVTELIVHFNGLSQVAKKIN
jgi:CubicO group peptidase (beta-lactamase class C family)